MQPFYTNCVGKQLVLFCFVFIFIYLFYFCEGNDELFCGAERCYWYTSLAVNREGGVRSSGESFGCKHLCDLCNSTLRAKTLARPINNIKMTYKSLSAIDFTH